MINVTSQMFTLLNKQVHTVRNLHFLSKKVNFDVPRKIIELFWVKTRENAAVWDFLAIDNFLFHEKIVEFCQNWIFRQNFEFSNSVKLLSVLHYW